MKFQILRLCIMVSVFTRMPTVHGAPCGQGTSPDIGGKECSDDKHYCAAGSTCCAQSFGSPYCCSGPGGGNGFTCEQNIENKCVSKRTTFGASARSSGTTACSDGKSFCDYTEKCCDGNGLGAFCCPTGRSGIEDVSCGQSNQCLITDYSDSDNSHQGIPCGFGESVCVANSKCCGSGGNAWCCPGDSKCGTNKLSCISQGYTECLKSSDPNYQCAMCEFANKCNATTGQCNQLSHLSPDATLDATISMTSFNQSHTFGLIDFKDDNYGEFWKHMPFVGQAFRNVEAYENRTYELAEVIHTHGLAGETAVLLLHYHHQMVEGEILLETIDKTQAITRPMAVATLGDNYTVVPHSFALQKRHGRFVWVATEYVLDVDGKQMTRTQKMLSRAGFMDAMANKLLQTGLWTVFGLQTIHRDAVLLTTDETLIEESTKPWEEKDRISRFWPHPKSVLDYENNPTLLKTGWAFAVSGELTSWTCVDNCQCPHCNNNANGMDINGKKTELKATLPEPFFSANS